MRSYLLCILAITVLPLGACNLYFSGSDDPDPCEYGNDAPPSNFGDVPELLRNPQSGQCGDFYGGGGGGWTCDDTCGPCPATDSAGAPQFIPTWGVCEGMCNGLDENTCLATNTCRGIYTAEGFQECWETDQDVVPTTEPVDCNGLEAQDCSRYDYCSALHRGSCETPGADEAGAPAFVCAPEEFVSCFPESSDDEGCYDDSECGQGFSCNSAEICLAPPSNGNGDECPEELCGVPQPCYGFCVPTTAPGECDGEITCDQFMEPICPDGTVPGISDGCWTGSCIPLSSCPLSTCAEIQNEAMCVQRDDCNALYEGLDCECTPENCDCATWVFDSCESSDFGTPIEPA